MGVDDLRTEVAQDAGKLAGAGERCRQRPRAERDPRVYDLSKPVTLSAYGEWTKKAGFYEASNGQVKELVYDDASFSNPVKAASWEETPA